MIHKLNTLQWIILLLGLVFLIFSIYTLIRGAKRDKIISLTFLFLSVVGYILAEIRINNHNAKAFNYFGVHKLKGYNNSKDNKIEILPNNKYLIFNNKDTIVKGIWELSVSKDNSTILLLDGRIFGIGELEINNHNNK